MITVQPAPLNVYECMIAVQQAPVNVYECMIAVQQAPVNVPRRSFLISVFGAMTDAMQLTVTQDTTVREAIQLLLVKLGKTENHLEDYELQEGGSQRVLGMNERVLGTGRGKRRDSFLLHKKPWGIPLDDKHPHFRVCIYGVSETQDYTILQLPVTATVQDVIIRALEKARRTDAPDNVRLQMESRRKTKSEVLDKHAIMYEMQRKNHQATFHLTHHKTGRGSAKRKTLKVKPHKLVFQRKYLFNTEALG
ncbi:hypothetical protein LSAT2_026960 [Lamellibrachia satsuma]|nr:hypothetical protein LSAT2_026960 [Lamellibrachia satsuma]